MPTTSLDSQHLKIAPGKKLESGYHTTVSVTYGVGLHDRCGCRPLGKLDKRLRPSLEAVYNLVVLKTRNGSDSRIPCIFAEVRSADV